MDGHVRALARRDRVAAGDTAADGLATVEQQRPVHPQQLRGDRVRRRVGRSHHHLAFEGKMTRQRSGSEHRGLLGWHVDRGMAPVDPYPCDANVVHAVERQIDVAQRVDAAHGAAAGEERGDGERERRGYTRRRAVRNQPGGITFDGRCDGLVHSVWQVLARRNARCTECRSHRASTRGSEEQMGIVSSVAPWYWKSMRGVVTAALLSVVLATGCMPGFGYYPGFGSPGPYRGYYSPPYYREYDAPYYGSWGGWGGGGGMSRDEARDMAREQQAQRQRLQREQQERRQDLLDKQAQRRDRKQADDAWSKKNVNWQKQQRQQQNERFQKQRQDLKQWQDQQWNR